MENYKGTSGSAEQGDFISMAPSLLPQEKEATNKLSVALNKIDRLTNQMKDLELTVSELWNMLERATESNLDLQAKCDELSKSLELERRLFGCQEKILDDSGISVDEGQDGATNIYEETIQDLVLAQESQEEELRSLKKHYEEKLKALRFEHEAGVTEILEGSNYQVQKLMQENEAIIQDLLRGWEELFDHLKNQYNDEAKTDEELTSSSGENIIVQFNALPPHIKGLVVAGITVISASTAGWAGWGFITWVWPRLLAFEEMVAGDGQKYLTFLLDFLNSPQFQKFVTSWEEGRSLGECLEVFANSEFFSYAMQMGPDLFALLKSHQCGPD